jgi:hypothetical protein
MTITIEATSSEIQLLEAEAARRGLTSAQLAQELFAEGLEELEADERAARILEATDPKKWRTLDDLRRAVRG